MVAASICGERGDRRMEDKEGGGKRRRWGRRGDGVPSWVGRSGCADGFVGRFVCSGFLCVAVQNHRDFLKISTDP
jgi:hypothetical protein